MPRRNAQRGPRTMVVHVVIECPNVPHPESDRADWCMDEIADHMERSGLSDQGYRWYIDDAHMKDGIPATVAVRIPHSDADHIAAALRDAVESNVIDEDRFDRLADSIIHSVRRTAL